MLYPHILTFFLSWKFSQEESTRCASIMLIFYSNIIKEMMILNLYFIWFFEYVLGLRLGPQIEMKMNILDFRSCVSSSLPPRTQMNYEQILQ